MVIQGHRFWYQSKAHILFLLVINTNVPPVLHRFRDIAFDKSKIAILATALAFSPPMEQFPTSYHRKWYFAKKLETLGYISVAESLGISSTTFTQCTPDATDFAEITQNNGHYAVHGHSRSPILVPIESSLCDFLLVINTNLPRILHRFWDIAFVRSKSLYFATLLGFNSPDGGVPRTISIKFYVHVNGWPRYQMP